MSQYIQWAPLETATLVTLRTWIEKIRQICFRIERKEFDISLENLRQKLRDRVTEKSRGHSAIRFGNQELEALPRGVEKCCEDKSGGRFQSLWVEEGRYACLESIRNKERRSCCIQCGTPGESQM